MSMHSDLQRYCRSRCASSLRQWQSPRVWGACRGCGWERWFEPPVEYYSFNDPTKLIYVTLAEVVANVPEDADEDDDGPVQSGNLLTWYPEAQLLTFYFPSVNKLEGDDEDEVDDLTSHLFPRSHLVFLEDKKLPKDKGGIMRIWNTPPYVPHCLKKKTVSQQ